jgi:hypothetical protein
MAEAVALGSIVGAEAASKQLGIGPSAIRRWMARAGKTPADAIASADWAQLGEMARAQVASALLAGKVRPKDAAVIAAMPDRNLAKPEPVAEPVTPEDTWGDDIEAALLKHHKGHAAIAMVALIEWFERLVTHDPAGAAPTIPECLAYLQGLGDLTKWHDARAAADHEAMLVQLEKNRQAAAEWTRKSLDAETHA